MDEISKRTAPQRDVLAINRTGSWGKVEYRHMLSCGHTEIRKRKSEAPQIACTLCAVAVKAKEEFGTLVVATQRKPLPVVDVDLIDWYEDEIAGEETKIREIVFLIASKFGVETDAVNVVLGGWNEETGISYATVFLDREAINRITEE